METKLARISQMSRENPAMIFTSIGHLINKEILKSCHEAMDGTKAKGIDGVSKSDYEEHLDENLNRLVDRLKRKAYHPQPARRVEIPKDNGKTRPLSTASRKNCRPKEENACQRICWRCWTGLRICGDADTEKAVWPDNGNEVRHRR